MKRNAPKSRLSGENAGQTTIELFMVLAVSFVALGIIYTLYSTQVFAGLDLRDSSAAKGTVQRVVSAANFVYLAGPGSQMKIWVQMPDSADIGQSAISGKNVSVRLLNGTDVLAIADVSILGNWKGEPGGYYMWLTYDGNSVIAHYNPFEINKQGIFVLLAQGSMASDYFLIRNNTSDSEEFWISRNFADGNIVLAISPGYGRFTLAPNDIKRIDLNFASGADSFGNYAGSLVVTGQSEDENYVRVLAVSAEVVLQSSPLTIYPKRTVFNNEESRCGGPNPVKYFVACNSDDSEISGISWSATGTGITPVSQLATDPGTLLSSVPAQRCVSFPLNFFINGAGNGPVYIDLNANYSLGRSYSVRIQMNKNNCGN